MEELKGALVLKQFEKARKMVSVSCINCVLTSRLYIVWKGKGILELWR